MPAGRCFPGPGTSTVESGVSVSLCAKFANSRAAATPIPATLAEGKANMSVTSIAKLVSGSLVLGLAAAAAPATAVLAQQKEAPPDFSSHDVGWVGLNGGGPFFEAVPGQIPPVTQDPAHPFTPNGVGKQPTFRIADLSNPNLKPWVKERMKKDNDEVLAGKVAFTWGSSCMPDGVPGFMGNGGPNPVYFLQTPKEVWIISRAISRSAASTWTCRIRPIRSHHGTASRSATMRAIRWSSIRSARTTSYRAMFTARRTPKNCTSSSAGEWSTTAR